MSDPVTYQKLGELDGKLDMLIDLVRQHSDDDKRIHEGQEKRIAALEATDNQSKGKTSAIATLAGVIGGGLAAWIGRHL